MNHLFTVLSIKIIKLRSSRPKYRLFPTFLGKYGPFFDDFFQVRKYTDFLRIYGPLYKHCNVKTSYVMTSYVMMCYFMMSYTLFFLRINIFQPSLKLILNFSRFQPRNILRWFLKVEMTRDLLPHRMQVLAKIPMGTYLKV